MTDSGGPVTMLLVEDNPADILFFREALEESALPVRLYTVTNGVLALEFLCRQGAFVDAPRPDVVVLDLNLPMMNGREVLVEMMANQGLPRMPVAVLTTSTSDRDVTEICQPGQCLYLTKTDDFQRLQENLRQIVLHARRMP